ncbi:MAG: DUF190 domain-containing protein [Bacteroidales bacterium]
MKQGEEKKLLRIFIREDSIYDDKPLFVVIIQKAKDLKLAGATVLRGIMGYTANRISGSDDPIHLSEELHVVVEIVDSEANLEKIMPFLDVVITEGLITIETVKIVRSMGM